MLTRELQVGVVLLERAEADRALVVPILLASHHHVFELVEKLGGRGRGNNAVEEDSGLVLGGNDRVKNLICTVPVFKIDAWGFLSAIYYLINEHENNTDEFQILIRSDILGTDC